MHGLGDDGQGWSEVVPSLRLPASLRVRFLFPHAPVMPVSINQGFSMRAWYDVRAANLTERADVDGVRRSQRQVEALIAREATRGVAASRIVLAGFSQGGAIALFAGLRHPQRLAGLVALSTYLVGAATCSPPRRARRTATCRSSWRTARATRSCSSRGRRRSRDALVAPAAASSGTSTRWSTRRRSRRLPTSGNFSARYSRHARVIAGAPAVSAAPRAPAAIARRAYATRPALLAPPARSFAPAQLPRRPPRAISRR